MKISELTLESSILTLQQISMISGSHAKQYRWLMKKRVKLRKPYSWPCLRTQLPASCTLETASQNDHRLCSSPHVASQTHGSWGGDAGKGFAAKFARAVC